MVRPMAAASIVPVCTDIGGDMTAANTTTVTTTMAMWTVFVAMDFRVQLINQGMNKQSTGKLQKANNNDHEQQYR